MKRIICIGNSLVAQDSAGFRVFLRLAARELPADVELIDGGLCGLDLIRFVEGAERVVFVDAVSGVARPGETVTLDAAQVSALAQVSYGHEAGLPYLLRLLPAACDGPIPPITLVGLEGEFAAQGIEEAASLALAIAAQGSSVTQGTPGPEARC